LTHVRDGANAVYQFESAQGRQRLFLRLTDQRHRSRCQIEAELDFVRFVAERDVAVAVPLPSEHGAYVETAHDDAGNSCHGAVFAAAPGRQFRFFSPDVSEPLFRAWGSAMGALHTASRAFIPVASRRRPSWSEQDSTRCDSGRLPASETAALREHDRVFAWLESLATTPDCWGLIHGDCERTNVTWDGRTVRILDFDDACYHWYLADVAHALWAFRRAPVDDRARFLRWFIGGYAEYGSLDANVREHLSWFVRLRTLSLFLQRLTPGGPTTDRAWTQQVRAAFDMPFQW